MANPGIHRSLSESIMNALVYYDIFNYPLKSSEVFRFISFPAIREYDVEQELDSLCSLGLIFKFNEFYSLQNNAQSISRRVKGNIEAEKCMPLALKKAEIIMRFPFVRSVMASGSLSKGYMDETSDLDFFIVTTAGNLWIARTLLVLYKRIFLFNSHKHFCVNYFIDEDHLEIEEKNLFTATELATVIPLRGSGYYPRLHQKNQWLLDFFPNYYHRDDSGSIDRPIHWHKRFLEKTFDLIAGKWLNSLLMRLTLNRWEKLYQNKYSENDFRVAFKTKKHSSKNHPRNYQKKVMEIYEEKRIVIHEKFLQYQKILQ